jgi:hypothetical protein
MTDPDMTDDDYDDDDLESIRATKARGVPVRIVASRAEYWAARLDSSDTV